MKAEKYRNILLGVTMIIAELLLLSSSPARAASLVDGVATAVPSLVHIRVTLKPSAQNAQNESSKTRQENSALERTRSGAVTGSGVVISSDGYIYSVSHLFDNAERVQIWTSDKRRFDAKIVGRDVVQNIALLKIETSGLSPARIGNPMQARLGESIFSGGMLLEELEFEQVVTDGIISSVGFKTATFDMPLIQTTSQITPGIVGGGLFNEKGELLGLSSVIYVNKDMGQAMSFAIPIDRAMAALPQLKQYGRIRRSSIGVKVGEVTRDIVSVLGLADTAGALVQAVEPGSPAHDAGILPGDVIIQFGQAPIKRNVDIPKEVGSVAPGTVVPVKLWRNGQLKELPVTTRELRIY